MHTAISWDRCRCCRRGYRLGHGMLPAGYPQRGGYGWAKLNWGDADVSLELIRKICHREGFGDILAEGCARAADIVGRDSGYYAMHIKGQDLYECCRGSIGWSLVPPLPPGEEPIRPARLSRDPSQTQCGEGKAGLWHEGLDKALEYEGKAKMVAYMEAVSTDRQLPWDLSSQYDLFRC